MKDRSGFLVEINDSKFGKGLFARKDLPANTVICKIDGPPMNFSDTIVLKEKESHTLQVDLDKYIYCNLPFLFTNHSCNPNCGVNNNFEMITLVKINKGQEL